MYATSFWSLPPLPSAFLSTSSHTNSHSHPALPAPPPILHRPPRQLVAPELIGCLLVKCQAHSELLLDVIVETEAYCQSEPGCHGYRRRSPSNETLFGEPGRFNVYASYGIHHCVNVVTHRADWANGVLLRAAWLPDEQERVVAGPALLARRFGIERSDDTQPVHTVQGLWIAPRGRVPSCGVKPEARLP